jgi:hypothetical protein
MLARTLVQWSVSVPVFATGARVYGSRTVVYAPTRRCSGCAGLSLTRPCPRPISCTPTRAHGASRDSRPAPTDGATNERGGKQLHEDRSSRVHLAKRDPSNRRFAGGLDQREKLCSAITSAAIWGLADLHSDLPDRQNLQSGQTRGKAPR